ncbi:3'-5' exonuclease isoform X2 [Cryptomeria japonica]|uniref:3'-5' exonuclease isoform X2 n=1 Tax=Cryptomeria japonica TaxID=3369 RepID=UPI0027DA6CAB|nr:3'-5' exonuclease isoform X2 [Cryptomeria japonica]
MAASTNSIEDLAIPYEWVDADEFEAIENALAEATKSHKRVKMSPSDDIAADSAGRRLPDWAGNSSKIVTYGSSHKPRVSINSDDNSIDYSVQGQRIESPNLNLSHSWLFSVPLCRAPLKAIVPKINFGGRIVYSRLPSEVEKASMEILQIVNSKKSNMEGRVPVGLDLEWKPFYNRVGEVPTKVAVLQICLDADRCDVMHIIHSGIPPVLRSLLEDESSVKVDKPMNIRCGNWEVENLSVPQLQYAATDAYASWYLYEVLKSLPDVIMANSKEEENH